MSSEMFESLGELIKKEIEKRGLKASFIAKKMGISRQTLNAIGLRKNFDLEWLQKLKAASGIDFTEYAPKSIQRINTPYSTENGISESFEEPFSNKISNKIEIYLSLKITGDDDQVGKIGDLIKSLKSEANKFGFNIS